MDSELRVPQSHAALGLAGQYRWRIHHMQAIHHIKSPRFCCISRRPKDLALAAGAAGQFPRSKVAAEASDSERSAHDCCISLDLRGLALAAGTAD